MKTKRHVLCLISITVAALSTGCIVKETVTVNGEVQESGYKTVTSPLQDVSE
jgi:hypothetical protein